MSESDNNANPWDEVRKKFKEGEYEQFDEANNAWGGENIRLAYEWIKDLNGKIRNSTEEYFFLKLYGIVELAEYETKVKLYHFIREDEGGFGKYKKATKLDGTMHIYLHYRYEATSLLEKIAAKFSEDESFILYFLRNTDCHPRLSGFTIGMKKYKEGHLAELIKTEEYADYKRLIVKPKAMFIPDFMEMLADRGIVEDLKLLEAQYLRLYTYGKIPVQ